MRVGFYLGLESIKTEENIYQCPAPLPGMQFSCPFLPVLTGSSFVARTDHTSLVCCIPLSQHKSSENLPECTLGLSRSTAHILQASPGSLNSHLLPACGFLTQHLPLSLQAATLSLNLESLLSCALSSEATSP